MTSRLIAQWSAGRLIQSMWVYRLVELGGEDNEEGVYLLQVELSDGTFIPAIGHFEARRVASGLIEEDRERVRAEIEAYEEEETRREEREHHLLIGEFGERKEA